MALGMTELLATHSDEESPFNPSRINGDIAKAALHSQIRANASYVEARSYQSYAISREKKIDSVDIARAMNLEHTVKEAPRFKDQVNDATRTNTITAKKIRNEADDIELTEHEALVDLDSYLLDVIDARFAPDDNGESADFDEVAKDMRESLTFIGEKELTEACAGLAEYWKSILSQDNDTQLFIATGYVRRHHKKQYKSDDYITDRILAHFSDEELSQWASRLVVRYDDINVTPDKLRTILVDDWAISGGQMEAVTLSLAKLDPSILPTLEHHAIAASDERIATGLRINSIGTDADPIRDAIPVYVYYRANPSTIQTERGIITGAHSSVDFGFYDEMALISGAAQEDLERNDISQDERDRFQRLARPPLLADVRQLYRLKGVQYNQKDRLVALRRS